MKILLISHTCMSATLGQPKLHALCHDPDIELTVLVPDRMFSDGKWRELDTPKDPPFRFVTGSTRWHSVRGKWYLMHFGSDLARVLEETQPDIVDIWEEPWGLMCAQAIWETRRRCPNAKIVVETEQNVMKRLPPPFAQLQSYSLANADFVVARSQEALDVVKNKGYKGATRVIGNGVDCALFDRVTPALRSLIRSNHGWSPEMFVIGYAGRIVAEKGLADAVDALKLLPQSAKLVFVGHGPFQAELATQSEALGVADRVGFIGDVPHDELALLMNAFDVLVLPSRTTPSWKEQFGRVLIEAGACGIPVVGSDSGAIPGVVADGGVFFPEGNVPAFAASLLELQSRPDARRELGDAAWRHTREHYSWHRVADQYRAIYCSFAPATAPAMAPHCHAQVSSQSVSEPVMAKGGN